MSDPIIISVSPKINSHRGGELITITGTNFLPKDKVIISNHTQAIESIRPTEIKFRSYPINVGTYPILIKRIDETSGLASNFTFENAIIFNNQYNSNKLYSNKDVIGKGISYPVTFSNSFKKNELLLTTSGYDVIKQSIHVILSTRPGQRFYNLQFGCKIGELIFEPNDDILKDLLYVYILEALDRWEPRIQVTNISYELRQNDEHFIGIRINYFILETNVADSYVYPFIRGGMPSSNLHI